MVLQARGWCHSRSWLPQLRVPPTAQGVVGLWRCVLQGVMKPFAGLPKRWDRSGSDPSEHLEREKKLLLGLTGQSGSSHLG